MRAIATEAGVSVGNAYYYFESKEQLIQGFYDRAQIDHAAAARTVLEAETDLAARIVGVGEAWLGVDGALPPVRRQVLQERRRAHQPTQPLQRRVEPRPRRAVDLWREVLDGSDARPQAAAAELPELLWLYFMGIVLFWVHDPTPDVSATRRVLQRTAPLVVRAIALTRLPVMRSLLDDLVGLLHDIRQVFPATATSEPPGSP